MTYRHFFTPFLLQAGIAAWLIFYSLVSYAGEASISVSVSTHSGDDISFDVFKSTRKKAALRVLWIAPGFGIDPRLRQTAEALAKQGTEVWLIDLADALFMTKGARSLRDIPAELVADLITAIIAHNNRNTDLLVVSSTYGAIPAIRGVRAWQAQTVRSKTTRKPGSPTLLGTVLFSPSFFSYIPELGKAPVFIPELAATNAPLYIFQAENNGNRWSLSAVLAQLTSAPVFVEMLQDVLSVFYQRDTAPETLTQLKNAPKMILRAARLLRRESMPQKPLPLSTASTTTPTTTVSRPSKSGLNTGLKPYTGDATARPIRLTDAKGRHFDIHDYRGKVTLINFWATWCPPCVKEIPSLNRLKQAMNGKPFQLISVNYAESANDIRAFLDNVNVDFPVLIDPGGKLTSQWKVLAFPSTFVIGPDGNIQYGVNAGIHWDTEAIIAQLNNLLPTLKNQNTE
ncbi:MAG: TlpA family protein disulfide reductase [Ectothiorhodospiraceae bacterium]|nr:TlpA family protein disulfide reductase [Ectothiorhodospiraceae bacterium]